MMKNRISAFFWCFMAGLLCTKCLFEAFIHEFWQYQGLVRDERRRENFSKAVRGAWKASLSR